METFCLFLVGLVCIFLALKGFQKTAELKQKNQQIDQLLLALSAANRSSMILDKLAYSDVVTGLPNRRYFLSHLHQAIERVEGSDQRLAVIFLDVDAFKSINDTHGHPAGDSLLTAIGSRLKSWIRRTDCLARWGGDEFGIVIESAQKESDFQAVMNRCMAAMQEPFRLENTAIKVSLSGGLALYPEEGVSPEVLLKNADIAMYRAKKQRKDRSAAFN